ncbi:MAG: alpha/beta hydrolase [Myxococcota bacterium]
MMEHAGLRRSRLIVHDYGVSVTQELLARQQEGAPYTFESVVFLNGGLFPEAHRARPIQRVLGGRLGPLLNRMISYRRFAQSLSAVFAPTTQPSEEELKELWRIINHPHQSRQAHRLIAYMEERVRHRDRWVQALRTCPVPLRLINGLLDPVSGEHMVERFREVVDCEADVVPLPHIGHYPQLEDPAGCLEGIWSFTAGGYCSPP